MKNTDSELVNFLRQGGIPERYLKETNQDLDFSRKLGVSISGSLFITGPVGTGKTQLVVDLLTELAERLKAERSVFDWDNSERVEQVVKYYDPNLFRFYNVPKLLTDLRDFESQSFSKLLEDLEKVRYLVLDDLGVEKVSEWVQEQMYVLINERYENNKQVLITSNKNIKEIASGLGERIASRLVEMCQIETLKGQDLRLK